MTATAYVTITLDGTVDAAARSRVEARMARLLVTDPDMSGATLDYERGDVLSVECRDETLAAQLYRVVCDALDEAGEP